MKLALLPILGLASSLISATSAIPSNVSHHVPTNSILTRRQSEDCPVFPYLKFQNNCPKGTTLAVYISGYAFTLNSVHDNAKQSFVYRDEFENHNNFYAMVNQGANGGPDPVAASYVNTYFFQERYWFIKRSEVKKIIPVSITPDKPKRQGFCVPIKCDSKSCISDSDFPEGRRSLEEEHTSIQARQVDNTPWPPPIYTCPEAESFVVTYCPDGKL
ncbi:hypothetical protein BDV98DRAFT_572508 [Pterulicium gracile]|uniref:Uncharacterized protein n=1 Tax=Pterulicium gracile TaxID=1884261 RepID=A0A5C3Q9H5_9AGAR|nr:hypothetical protein BDV98DRAFT_572508 [Pterula gracilis]